jgi:hypothetical protein
MPTTLKLKADKTPDLKVTWEDDFTDPPWWPCAPGCDHHHDLWLMASVEISVPGASLCLAHFGGIAVASMSDPYVAEIERELLDDARRALSEMTEGYGDQEPPMLLCIHSRLPEPLAPVTSPSNTGADR